MAPDFKRLAWNASGATQCYAKKKTIRSYVVEVILSSAVDGQLLQQAVDRTLVRLPYYRWSIVRHRGRFYYAENDLPFLVAEHDGPRYLGGADTNYHVIDVTYFGEKIDFAMWHTLCDGLGFNRFIEAVLYHYMCLKDGVAYDDEGVYTERVPFDEAETLDPFHKRGKISLREMKELSRTDGRFHFPELDEPDGKGPEMHRLPLSIKTEEFLAWCKANGSSPAAAVAAIMAKGIAREHKVDEGTIMAVVPISVRRHLNAEKTFKNCDVAVFVGMDAADVNALSTGELAGKARTVLKDQMNNGTAERVYAAMSTIVHLGSKMPTFGLKTALLATSENHPQNTFFVDYVGSLRAKGFEDQILEVRYLNPDPGCGSCFVLMSETAGRFHINLTQSFASDRYYQAFCAVLDDEGIAYERLERGTYLNPAIERPQERR